MHPSHSLALLVALGLPNVVLPALVDAARQSRRLKAEPTTLTSNGQAVTGRIRSILVAGVTAYGLCAALLAPFVPGTSTVVLRPGEVEALNWIRNSTPPSGSFLVVSGRVKWEIDPLSEWFPALTKGVSLATPQGREWLGGWAQAVERHEALQHCARQGLRCLERWMAEDPTDFDYVLVARYPETSDIQTEGFVEGLAGSRQFQMVFSNDQAAVFAFVPEAVP
jgi:hypothetical protein